MAFEIHREPLYRRYYAPVYSGACVYAIILGFLSIFIPFIISYNTGNFWQKEKVIYEQPDVDYRYISMFQFYGYSGQNKDPFSVFYSTSAYINDLMGDRVRGAVVRSSEVDTNLDGSMDRLEVGVQLPLTSSEHITGMHAFFYCDTVLKKFARFKFDSVSFVSHDSGFPMGNLDVSGNLMLKQTRALGQRGGFRLPYQDEPLLEMSASMSADEVDIGNLMRRAAARNLSTVFEPTYAYATPHVSSSSSEPTFYNATISMHVPLQPVLVITSATEVLKFAWIQFLSFFVVVGFLLVRTTSFIFRHRLIWATTETDVVHEKLHSD